MFYKHNNIPKNLADRELLTSNVDQSFIKIGSDFYHFEPGIVLDIILDDRHPLFNIYGGSIILPNEYPVNYKNVAPTTGEKSYSTIGCALIRLVYSQESIEKEKVVLAYPMDKNYTTLPLLNELVQVVYYIDTYYYTNRLQSSTLINSMNSTADFRLESTYGKNLGNRPYKGIGNYYTGPISKFDSTNESDYPGLRGQLGQYFQFNNKIRSLRRREGDTVVESRFGQSIRFGSYDDDRNIDIGVKNTEYFGGGGNPFILIRNRQRPLSKDEDFSIYPRVNPIGKISKNINEKNSDGYMIEDVNNDGSSIHITSGLTLSKFVTTCFKHTFSKDVSEEQRGYNGGTLYSTPILTGNQIVINSDRLVLSSKLSETLHYSKSRYAITTDSQYSVDAHDQIVLTTNNKTVINSPAIYLGQYDVTDEPVLLGQTTVNWLYDLCQWILDHTHWYKHSHPDAGEASPDKTQKPVEQRQLKDLQNVLHTLMSRRVFVTGGGFAAGANGGNVEQAPTGPTNISVSSGDGVPGGWKGKNRR